MEVEVRKLRLDDGGTMDFPKSVSRPTWNAHIFQVVSRPSGLGTVLRQGMVWSKNVDIPVHLFSQASFWRPYEMPAGGIFDYLPSRLITPLSQRTELQTVLGKWNLAAGGFTTSECLVASEPCEDNDIERMWKRFRCRHAHFCISRSRLLFSVMAFAALPLMCSEHHLE